MRINNRKPKAASQTRGVAGVVAPLRKLDTRVWLGISVLLVVGGFILVRSRAGTTPVVVDTTLPNPSNIVAYADDQLVTVTWTAPANAAAKNIVGYFVTWGPQSTGVYVGSKQTAHEITQIQPLANGTVYIVKVQSVQGSVVQVGTSGSWNGGTAPESHANGKVSPGGTVLATPSSARVDQLRQQMTGFFDDFSLPMGALDELKWNHAASSCARPGSVGTFINAQFHAHSQVRSSLDPYCDRSEIIDRARATFDITGRTESNPGVVVGDFDGTTMESGRDIWYIDLIPLNARVGNVPLDITSHADAGDTSIADPAMIRLVQNRTSVSLKYTDATKIPRGVNQTFNICPDFKNDLDFQWCGQAAPVVHSVFPEVPIIPWTGKFPVPNVRAHWRLEVSPTKLKVFLNGVDILEGDMPTDFANTKKYTVESNLFSYNTGKDSPNEKPQTALLHWDNFGFNGPAPTTVVHNYLDGGANGTVPVIGTGSVVAPFVQNNHTTKINIADVIGAPSQSRLMFTLQDYGDQSYTWNAADNVVINGHKYNVASPAATELGPVPAGDIANKYLPYATSISVNPADLKQGTNDIAFNFIASDVDELNIHIELEYAKGTQPSYSPPSAVFGASTIMAAIMPGLLPHDAYLYVEQDMGLVPVQGDGMTPPSPQPTPTPTPTPIPTPTPPPNPVPAPTPSPKAGDVNGDGVINIFDASVVSAHWLQNGQTRTTGDLNGDGVVNIFDASIVSANWGK